MFTGIVKYLAEVKSAEMVQGSMRLEVECLELANLPLGSSICINGACMTLVSVLGNNLSFDVISESLDKTNLGSLKFGDYVNLEPSLTLTDGIDGHLVTGHVDYIAELVQINDLNEYYFSLNKDYSRFVALKGSVTINGVSLTVSELTSDYFKVSLIPTTLKETNLQFLKVGSKVNIEVDLIARYLDRLITKN